MTADGPSRVATLIHEVTHFTDVFDSTDQEGNFANCLKLAISDSVSALRNADNLAGYVIWGETYEG